MAVSIEVGRRACANLVAVSLYLMSSKNRLSPFDAGREPRSGKLGIHGA
jgi:hypothetical protein